MKDIIAIHIKGDVLTDSLGRTIKATSFKNIMDFVIINKPNTYIVCWNLYQLLDLIRKVIPLKSYQQLLDTDKVWIDDYKLFSVSGKQLSIGHEYRTLLHDNFYESQKIELNIYNLYKYFPDYKPTNANDIVIKGIELLNTAESMGIKDPTSIASGIAMADSTILDDIYIPHLYACPDEAIDMADYALELLTREWRTTYKIGNFVNATAIDINACYPSLVKDFGDLTNAKIWHGTKYEPCDFGIFNGHLTLNADIHPIVNKDKRNVVGKYNDMVTTEQWGFINHYHLGKFEPVDGWMVKYQNDYKPFYDLMTSLYKQREQGGLVSDLSKSISVGIIGQLAQYYDDKKGKRYNPIYSVMATSRASLKIGKLVYENNLQDNLIQVIVDGILIDKPMEFNNSKRELGACRSEQVKALILSLGHSFINNKYKTSYDDMMMAITTEPNYSTYNEVMLINELNTTNRIYKNYPTIGKDWINNIYKSKAVEVNDEQNN